MQIVDPQPLITAMSVMIYVTSGIIAVMAAYQWVELFIKQNNQKKE